MELSAISEVISQVNGTYLTNLSSALKMPATGEAVVNTDVDTITGEIDDSAMIASIYMEQASGESVLVRHLIPGTLAKKVFAKIKSTMDQITQTEPVAARSEKAPATESTAQPSSSSSMVSPSTEFSPATFSQLAATQAQAEGRNLDILLDVPLQVTVELGKTQIPIKKILEYSQGSLITLDKLAGEPIDLLVNGEYFAKGEVVVIDENFGVRITSILSPAERLAQLS
jgi:flagellar motor switch protein FliN/FliY